MEQNNRDECVERSESRVKERRQGGVVNTEDLWGKLFKILLF